MSAWQDGVFADEKVDVLMVVGEQVTVEAVDEGEDLQGGQVVGSEAGE